MSPGCPMGPSLARPPHRQRLERETGRRRAHHRDAARWFIPQSHRGTKASLLQHDPVPELAARRLTESCPHVAFRIDAGPVRCDQSAGTSRPVSA
jgi:hypothetical protein